MRSFVRWIAVAAVALILGPLCRPTRADPLVLSDPPPPPPPPVAWSMAAGLATALVPLGVGGGVFATRDDLDGKKAAVYTMSLGMVAAPIVSHLVAREWKRAAVFGALPLAFSLATITLLEIQPSVTMYGQPETRFLFGLFMGATAIASGGGLVDSLFAGERAQARRPKPPRVSVAPIIAPGAGTYGLALGGWL